MFAQRNGTRSELLKGPVVYGVVNGLAAILFWKASPVGIVSIAFLCAGDGLAEIVGSRFGSTNRLPYSPDKVSSLSLSCICIQLMNIGMLPWATCIHLEMPFAAVPGLRLRGTDGDVSLLEGELQIRSPVSPASSPFHSCE